MNAALPGSNFGSLPQLEIGNGSSAVLRFDLGLLPPGLDPNTVGKATLLLYVNRVPQAGRINVVPLQSAWTESSVTFSTRPLPGTTVATGLELTEHPQFPAVIFIDSRENVATGRPAVLEFTGTAFAALRKFRASRDLPDLRGRKDARLNSANGTRRAHWYGWPCLGV